MTNRVTYFSLFFLIFYIIQSNILHTTGQQSSTRREKQRVNFYGELQDSYGNTFNVDNISIAGDVDNIKVYEKPLDADADPANNTDTVNLEQFSEIRPVDTENPKNNVVRYASTDYVSLVFTYKNLEKKEHTYLIKNSHKLFCTKVNGGELADKEVAFEAVKKLTIVGKMLREEKPNTPNESTEKRARKENQCAKAAHTIYDLEEIIKKINDPHKGSLEEFVSNIKDLVGGICNS